MIATWKWKILKFSPHLFSHFSHAKLVNIYTILVSIVANHYTCASNPISCGPWNWVWHELYLSLRTTLDSYSPNCKDLGYLVVKICLGQIYNLVIYEVLLVNTFARQVAHWGLFITGDNILLEEHIPTTIKYQNKSAFQRQGTPKLSLWFHQILRWFRADH